MFTLDDSGVVALGIVVLFLVLLVPSVLIKLALIRSLDRIAPLPEGAPVERWSFWRLLGWVALISEERVFRGHKFRLNGTTSWFRQHFGMHLVVYLRAPGEKFCIRTRSKLMRLERLCVLPMLPEGKDMEGLSDQFCAHYVGRWSGTRGLPHLSAAIQDRILSVRKDLVQLEFNGAVLDCVFLWTVVSERKLRAAMEAISEIADQYSTKPV